jgi:putative ABC transport system substrate-binding protein
MMRRRALLPLAAAAGLVLPWTAAARASSQRLPRVGVLRWGSAGDDAVSSLREALAAIGHVEGRSVLVEWRFATRPELAQRHAAELLAWSPALIVASAPPAAAALRDATRSVPIVLYGVADPVGLGLVASLASPGGNITGVSSNLQATVPKQMQLLDEVLGGMRRVAFLGSRHDPSTALFVQQARDAARALGATLQTLLIGQVSEYAAALDAMQRERVQALVVQPLLAIGQPAQMAEPLLRRKLPAVSASRPFVAAGGLMSYGYSRAELARRTASFIDRILKGASPAELPVEEPTLYELVLNLGTARHLGLALPPPLRLRADEVIE